MRRTAVWGPLLLALVLGTEACSDNSTSTTPSPPPAVTFTDTFSGTIDRNGAATHTFAVATSGTVTATLTSLAPDNTVTIGFSLGTWNGALCQIVLANDKAVVGNVITGSASSIGNLCVRMYDVGALTQATSYEVQVVHP